MKYTVKELIQLSMFVLNVNFSRAESPYLSRNSPQNILVVLWNIHWWRYAAQLEWLNIASELQRT